jgi:hypothetical protein
MTLNTTSVPTEFTPST